jgi:hypothetical protein
MMRELASIAVLLALCIPALAVDMPDMVGNWTGTFYGVGWLKNTDYQTTGKPDYWEDTYRLSIEEQNGTRFAGKITRVQNPLASEVLLGIISSDNKSIALVDEDGYLWGWMNSPTEMDLSAQVVDIDYMDLYEGIFTKEQPKS